MFTLTLKLIKPLALGIALIALFAVGQKTTRAAEVTIAGNTNGCFNANVAGGCVAGVPPSTGGTYQNATLLGLQYNNAVFSGTTSGGFMGLGGNPVVGGLNTNNLGSFTLANSLATYSGNAFTLRVTFTQPTGINGGGSTLFSATLTGNVTSTGNGGVFIDFNNTPQLFTFSFGNTTGSFLFAVNDLSINPGQTSDLTGQITAAQQTAVPEPTTMLLLGTGLAGVASRIRRRRKAMQDSV